MLKSWLQNCLNAVQVVVLLAVFAGLLFSRGEGIRLFPFPPEDVARQYSSKLQNNDQRDYERNFRRFENDQKNSQSKIQRDNPQHLAGISKTLGRTPFPVLFARLNLNISSDSLRFEPCLLFSACGSRAPPVS